MTAAPTCKEGVEPKTSGSNCSSVTRGALEEEIELMRKEILRLRQELGRDGLTGLGNRLGFQQFMAAEATKHRDADAPSGAVVFLDCDDFKSINDRFGHLVGDAVLCELSKRLRSAVRKSDFVGRFGGDEFVVVLTGSSWLSAQRRLSAIEAAVVGTYRVCGVSVPVGVSSGMAPLRPCQSPDAALGLADQAMYASKRCKERGKASCLDS